LSIKDEGVQILPDELKRLKAGYRLRKAAEGRDVGGPTRNTIEDSSNTEKEVKNYFISFRDAFDFTPLLQIELVCTSCNIVC